MYTITKLVQNNLTITKRIDLHIELCQPTIRHTKYNKQKHGSNNQIMPKHDQQCGKLEYNIVL